MKRVVSLALWGEWDRSGDGGSMQNYYWRSAIVAIAASRLIFPDWEIRVHHDSSLFRHPLGPILCASAARGEIVLVRMPDQGELCHKMLWRMFPAFDPTVERFICRDVDALPTPKDRLCVDAWCQSFAGLHVIRDSQSHTALVMGGLCGFKRDLLLDHCKWKSFDEMVREAGDLRRHGSDQNWLNSVWNRMFPSVAEHVFDGLRKNFTLPLPLASGYESSGLHQVMPRLGHMYHIDRAMEVLGMGELSQLSRSIVLNIDARKFMAAQVRVVISTTFNHDYDFYAPLTCMFWSKLIGYQPMLVIAVDRFNATTLENRLSFITREACEQGALVFVQGDRAFPDSTPFSTAQHIAQVSRLFGCTLNVSQDEVLMTGDVDMWPLDPEYFKIMDWDKMNLYGANIYKGDRHPMCYAAAKALIWRNMLRLNPGTTMAEALATVKWNGWDTDEDTLQRGIEYIGGKSVCAKKDRPGSRHGFMGGRVDRGRWVYNGKEEGLIDAHLPRPGYGDETWARVRRLIEDYLPDHVAWADDYLLRYLEVFDK